MAMEKSRSTKCAHRVLAGPAVPTGIELRFADRLRATTKPMANHRGPHDLQQMNKCGQET